VATPSTPKRELIARAFVGALEAIRSGDVYRTNAGANVSRRRLLEAELNSTRFPALSVFSGDSVEAEDSCMGAYRETADVLIDAWIDADAADVDAALNDLEADVTTAVLTDPTLAGAVLTCKRAKVQTDMQEFANRRRGFRPMRFVVDYTWTASAP
jgi:hypothetical protein